jgi:DNA repair exonuclease SbcCD nuclease subunit
MKISILSDFHIGFGLGTEREEDAYDGMKECIEKSMDCDLILMAGDIFDVRNPSAEMLAKTMEIMLEPLLEERKFDVIRFIDSDKQVAPMTELGIPIIAIHGTHERRAKGQMNPVEAVEKAGFIIYLHCNGVILERGEEKVCVQGMSGVPDQYAESVLKNWDPKPIPGYLNIFMIHQSISQFLYAPHAIDINVLPKGFDLYICGHMHEAKKSSYDGKPVLIPGSPITTQITKDSVNPRGFWKIDVQKNQIKNIDWVQIEKQRKVYYLEFEDESRIVEKIDEILKKPHDKKPLLKIVAPEIKDSLINEIKIRFGEKCIISFKKEVVEKPVLAAKTLNEQKLSVSELGRKLFRENLEEKNLDVQTFESVFEFLENDDYEKALELLKEKIKSNPSDK